MPLLAMLLAAQVLSAPSLAEVEALSPEQAGRLLLSGRTHGPILSAGRDTRPGGAPGFTDYELVEAARPLSGGCVRRRWTARFESSASAPGESPIYAGARSQEEVALPVNGSCPEDGYALLNGGVDGNGAIQLLDHLSRVAAGTVDASFDCRSEVGQDLCASADATRAGLRAAPVWAVMRSSEEAELWLGRRGGAVTVVRFAIDRPERIWVLRKIPAPF